MKKPATALCPSVAKERRPGGRHSTTLNGMDNGLWSTQNRERQMPLPVVTAYFGCPIIRCYIIGSTAIMLRDLLLCLPVRLLK